MIAELFYCLQGLKCVDTFPLFASSNAHRENHRLLPHGFQSTKKWAFFSNGFLSHCFLVTEKSVGHLLSRRPFPFSWCNFINGPKWLGSWWPSALWGSRLPSIQRILGGLITGQRKPFVTIPRYFVIMGSNKSESVISSLSVPWISGVSIHLCIWL